jgi:hypothetical protein
MYKTRTTMLQDITKPNITPEYLINLSPEDFILLKIKDRLNEVTALKDDYFKLTGIDADTVLNGFASQVVYPSKKDLEHNIAKFLDPMPHKVFKTNDLIKTYHNDIADKKVRLELTRRYSGALATMKKEGNMFSKEVKGEKGDLYCADQRTLELM